MPSWLVQAIIIEFFLIITAWRSKKLFGRIRTDKEIRKDLFIKLSSWKGEITDFIESRKYEYNREFWFTAIMITLSTFLVGIFSSVGQLFVPIMGLVPFVVFMGCSVYIIYRFCITILFIANKNAKGNIKFLLEERPAIGLTVKKYNELYGSYEL